MNIISEAFLVGLYSCILFFLLQTQISNVYILLFTLGFLKHFLSYFIGIHNYYCNKKNKTATFKPVFVQSILEGLFYLTSIFVLPTSLNLKLMYIFTMSTMTYIITEKSGINKYVYSKNCVQKTPRIKHL